MTRWPALLLASACLHTPAGYRCESDSDCDGGTAGRCESVGYCSYSDSTCTTGRRFGEFAGSYSNQCTGGVTSDGGLSRPQFARETHMRVPAGSGSGTVASSTFSVTVPDGAGLFLIVAVVMSNAGAVAAITYNDVALTQLDLVVGVPSNATTRSEQWMLVAPAVGTNDLVVSFSPDPDVAHIAAMVFTGVNQTQPVFAKAEGSGSAASSALVVASGPDQLVESTTGQGNSIAAIPAGETLQFLDNGTTNFTLDNAAGATENGVAPSVTLTWNYGGSDQWQTIVVSLQP